jgi:uncharacterized coiled-coil protein SlyX
MSDQHMMKIFHDQFTLNLQRLADGELSAAAQHEFLHGIDKHAPQQWRDVALTLLEQRLWDGQLKSPGFLQTAPTPPPRPRAATVHPTRRSLASRTTYILASCCLGLIAGLLIPINYGSQPIEHTAMHIPPSDHDMNSMQASTSERPGLAKKNPPGRSPEQIMVSETDRIAIDILENLARQGYRIDTQNYQLTDQWNNAQNVNPELTSFVAYPSGL